MRAQKLKSGNLVSIMLLVLCLLFVQCLGLTHSIAHAHPAGTTQVANLNAANAAGSFSHDASTSCAAFDEACVGVSLHTPHYFPPILPGAAFLSLWLAFQSWEQPFQRHFSSRAPPFA
jgi:hypothetical protein